MISEDFYCEQVLSDKTEIERILETDNVFAYHYTRPFYETHIVVIPKKNISSLLILEKSDETLLLELFDLTKQAAAEVRAERAAARVLTNLGNYQESKHLISVRL